MLLSLRWNKRTLAASIMLVAFALRMLTPPGFMPASGRPFALEICWEGLPVPMLAQAGPADAADSMDMGAMDMGAMHMGAMDMDSMPMGDPSSQRPLSQQRAHHPGSPSQGEHCVFGTACAAGPASHLPAPSDFHSAQPLRTAAFASIDAGVHVVHLPQPRAPPGRLT